MIEYRKDFPLFHKNNIVPCYFCKGEVKKLINEIKSGKLHLVTNHCLCKNEHPENDLVVLQNDRYGLPISSILCSKCGLIRSDVVFDKESSQLFYEKYYRRLYNYNLSASKYFKAQQKRGGQFVSILNSTIDLAEINKVAEIGCGAGGILSEFKKAGKTVIGVDLDTTFLQVGINEGLYLQNGDFYELIPNASCDLVIASHVLEHFTDPITEIMKIIAKIKPGKYLLLAVPGLYQKNNPQFNPISNFQNAHVIQYFYKEWLNSFFRQCNMKVIYGDEECIFVCQKANDSKSVFDEFFSPDLKSYFNRNASFLLTCRDKMKKQIEERNKVWFIIRKSLVILKYTLLSFFNGKHNEND